MALDRLAQVDPEFAPLLKEHFQLDELDKHPGAVFGVWPDSRIAYLNPAWHRFASENGGMPAIAQSWGLGRRYLDSIPPVIRPVYEHLLAHALETGLDAMHPVTHEYECSNATTFRTFRMQLYGLRGRGVLIVNTLMREAPHDHAHRTPEPADERRYRDHRGLIVMCSYCRRIQDPASLSRWDWVPAWVEAMPADLSHGACPICRDFHLTSAN
jgi:hypothetical protein